MLVVVVTATPGPPTPTTPPPTATATTLPSATPEPTPSLEPTATVPTYVSARVTAHNGLIIREAPSTSALILAYANYGDIIWLTGVKQTADGISWDQIVAPDGGLGWVSTRYLEIITP